MGCGTGCLKCLLILFNTLFGLIGVILLAGGAFILAAGNKVIRPYLDQAFSAIPGIPQGIGLKDAESVKIGDVTVDIVAILKPVAIFLVIFGLILVVCAIFGSCGSCCSNRIMLIIYAMLVIILLIIQIVCAALFFSGSLDKTIKNRMAQTITDHYVGIDDTGLWSMAWNALMIKFQCCGANNYTDFAKATKWKKSRVISIMGIDTPITLKTPIACCKFTGTLPNVTPVNQICATLPTDLISNWMTGCYEPLGDAMSSFRVHIIGGICGVIIFQFLCAVAAIVIAIYIQKEKDNHV